MMYMIMNRKTAECEVYGSKDVAKKNLTTDCFMFPCDDVNNKADAELLLYPNANKNPKLGWVAEYIAEDLLNDDLEIATESNPVKFMRGDINYI